MINKYMGPLMALYIFSKPFLKSLQQVMLYPSPKPSTYPTSTEWHPRQAMHSRTC